MAKEFSLAKATMSGSNAASVTFLVGKPNILLTLFFAAGGVFFIYSDATKIGLAILALAVLSITTSKGIELNMGTRQYRLFTSALGLRFGDWEPLPEVQHITMKYFSNLVESGKPGRMRIDKDARYVVMLSTLNSRQGIILLESGTYDSALALTNALATALEVEALVFDQNKHV